MAGVDDRIVGTCGNCGGEVCVPIAFHSTQQPTPRCTRCGSTPKVSGPVIPMNPEPVRDKNW